jgi:hypothetical protein
MVSFFCGFVCVVTASLFKAALVSAICPEVCLDVSQGSRYYGRFPPITTSTSVEDFYHYKHYSFNGDDIVPLLIDQSLFLIHYFDDDDDDDNNESDSCDLSLVIVHDSKDDSTGGQAHLVVTGNHENALVQDGPGDGSKSDQYLYLGEEADKTELFWEWGWQAGASKKYRTDGMADAWDWDSNNYNDKHKGCLEVSAKFIAGIDAWRYVYGPVDDITGRVDPRDYLFLDKDETLRVCKVDCGARAGKQEI